MEQLDFFSNKPNESWVFDQLTSSLLQVISDNNLSGNKLRLEHGKSYSSVWYDTQMAFRICLRGEHHYFGVSDYFADVTEKSILQRITKDGSSAGFVNYSFDPTPDDIALFSTFLASVLDRAVDNITKDFDCCSRYEECSNAKKCIHPNPDIAIGCGYRKIIKKGRIFYGCNRNVD